MGWTNYTLEDWTAVKDALSLGLSSRQVESRTNVKRQTVLRWSHLQRPPERLFMNRELPAIKEKPKGKRLDFQDRAIIYAMISEGRSPSEIARKIGFHRTTVSRELARMDKGHYEPKKAELLAYNAARRPKPRKLDANPALRKAVIDGLLSFYSPEQIAARLRCIYPNDTEMHVSHETIYQAIYIQGKGSLRQEIAVEQALRSGRTNRKPASRMPAHPRGKSWVEGCEISKRPAEVEDRALPGHWEGDLIIGSDMSSCLVTLVERKTRFLIARRFDCHESATIVDSLIEMAASVPESLRGGLCKTLTWDQGTELAEAARFTQATGFKVYFCDPHSPWQKGTNENTNGLIRQYFPKGTNFKKVTDEEVLAMQNSLNSRPRKTLGWLTPAEVLVEDLTGRRAMIV